MQTQVLITDDYAEWFGELAPHQRKSDIMAIRDIKELDAEYFTEEELRELRAEAAREILELNLKEMRESLALTQQELAERLEIAQSQLSRLENRDDHLVSTLRKYIEALGGEFEAYATFEGRKIKLLGV